MECIIQKMDLMTPEINILHECRFDKLVVINDVLYCLINGDVIFGQNVNYCPICGWSKSRSEIMKEQDKRDGI